MSLSAKKTLKRIVRLTVLAIILSAHLGCGTTSGDGPYKVFKRPTLPRAITEPHKVFLRCDDNPKAVESMYYCIEGGHLEELREWVIRVQSVLNKHERQIEVINE